jgi:hypothetical protein
MILISVIRIVSIIEIDMVLDLLVDALKEDLANLKV